MQITRHNFESALPAVKEAIHECDFLSFDCEMTGLFLDDNAHSMLDNMPARYSKVWFAALLCITVERVLCMSATSQCVNLLPT